MSIPKKKRIRLARPRPLTPIRSTVIDKDTGKPRVGDLSGSGPIRVWVCPYCFDWRSSRKHISDCCARHHQRNLGRWGKLIEAGVIEDPEKMYRGRHLPIRTFGDDEAHFIGGDDGRYLLELHDGNRFMQAEARIAGRPSSEHPHAVLLRRALKVWPKGARGRGE